MDQIKITQVKSSIGTIPEHRKTLKALGLSKIGQTRTHKKNPSVLGMIKCVEYLLKVEKV